MKYKLLLIIITILCYSSENIQARWATKEDANTEIKAYNIVVKINSDGTYEEETEIQVKLLNEVGREIFSKFSLHYNEEASLLSISSAKTILNGKEYKVPKKNIEDKPLASLGHGFDQIRQVSIAFPNVEIGSLIYLKYKLKVRKPDLERFYSSLYGFGLGELVTNGTLKIHSAIPLHIKINDPNNSLQIKQDAKDNVNDIEIKLVKPIYTATINEPNNSIVDLKHGTWISISSLKDWNDLAVKESPAYEKVINQPLPAKFQAIVEAAMTEQDELRQINLVTSMLSEKIQYMGDWRSVDGRFKPRDLDKIAQTQIGDCKDFTASAAAILKKLGYKAQAVLVRRGELAQDNLNILPSVSAFNHAMLKITTKQKKVYWIDPTNFISMAGGIFPDIENKMALVLDSSEPSYEKIPEINYKNSIIESNQEISIQDMLVDEHCDATIKGEKAAMFTGAGLNASKQVIEDTFFELINGIHIEEKNRKSSQLPQLNSRIVSDFNFKLHYEQKNLTFKTNLGNAYPLKSNWNETIIFTPSDNVGDLYIGFPYTRKKRILFKNAQAHSVDALNYNITSPWLVASRECKSTGDGLEITETIEILRSFIPGEDLKTIVYKNLRDALEKDTKNTAIVFSTK